MSESFFKFNKEIRNYFLDYSSENNIELSDKEYNRFTPYLNIFDINKNGSLDSNEIKNIWQSIEKECTSSGDELSINEKDAEKIIKEFDKDSKLNGKEFINFFKYLLTCITHRTSSWELQKHFIFNPEGGNLQEHITDDAVYTYYPSGALKSVENNDRSYTSYYANGAVCQKLDNDGIGTIYYSSGKILKKINVDRSYVKYYENGNKKEEKNENGEVEYYENGQIKSKFKDGKETSYYENGQIKRSNELSGYSYIEYYPNGQIKQALPKDGDFVEYDESGNAVEQKEIQDLEQNEKPEKQINNLLKTEPFDLNTFKNLMNTNSIVDILGNYYWNDYNIIKDIQENIKDKTTQQELINYIETTLEELYNENLKKIPKKSKIKNSNWEGAEYKIKWKNGKIYIKNLETKRKSAIDTQNLVKDLTKDKQYLLLIRLQNLPGEVLEDLAIDGAYTNLKLGNDANGDYRHWTDTIQLIGGSFSEGTIVHELGHAIDNLFMYAQYSTKQNNLLLTTFQEEQMSSGLMSGNGKKYAATDLQEFFAESYALLMLGDEYRAKECIEKNFPKSFAIVKEMIKEIRQLPPEVRHRQDLT